MGVSKRLRDTLAAHGEGTRGVEQNRCGLVSPPIWPSSNDGKNENPKPEEFSDLGDVKFTNTYGFDLLESQDSKLV